MRQGLDISGSLIERRQSRRQVRGVAFLRGHLLKSSGDLAQSLRPAGGRVRHHRDVVAHVAVVLREGDAGVDRRLARRDRHVRGVRDHDRSLEHTLSGARVVQVGELLEDLRHLVSALAAADVDYYVRVRPLRELVLKHRLSGSESARDRRRAALRYREEGVYDALSGDQRLGYRETLRDRARLANRPAAEHREGLFLALRGLVFYYRVVYRVISVRRGEGDFACRFRRGYQTVTDGARLVALGVDVAGLYFVACFHLHFDRPLLVRVDAGDVDAGGDIVSARRFEHFKRSADAVVHSGQKTRAEGRAHRHSGAGDGLARTDAGRVLVALDGGALFGQTYDFADKAGVADVDGLHHLEVGFALYRDDGSVYAVYFEFAHFVVSFSPSPDVTGPRRLVKNSFWRARSSSRVAFMDMPRDAE